MPRPWFQFTMRRLMLVVVGVALLLWLVLIGLRWADYRRRAEGHEETAGVLRGEIEILQNQGGQADEVAMRKQAMTDEIIEARKYRLAQGRPWRSIPSTPPER